jgi:hypothetical protein
MYRSWGGNKTQREDWSYLSQQICLEQEEYEEILFMVYFYLCHNLNILAYKHDAQLEL